MEKRIYERLSIPVKVTYELLSRPKVMNESVSKNISGGGICLSLREKLFPATQLAIKIEIGNNSNIIHLKGKVIWNRKVEILQKEGPAIYYDTGIELIDADPININRVITHFYGKSF
jgi:hypothetical protein